MDNRATGSEWRGSKQIYLYNIKQKLLKSKLSIQLCPYFQVNQPPSTLLFIYIFTLFTVMFDLLSIFYLGKTNIT